MSSNSRYPNFFLVDFYEKASGGALQAAAQMNGVTYVAKSLGKGSISAISTFFGGQNQIRNIAIVASVGVAVLIIVWVASCKEGLDERASHEVLKHSASND
ncbi:protein of unknown function [Taphrina deformans PYCC 5710]|uniref:Uncharacterized protein n=1 Tax=Taphrina deformans (strain PYCC 5710 / ATCC 11124 / CBS 356.35 / IMI 108563 / JCM 9778 / NBRC 8474) TaxID=1097556 RepID=R4XE22_TAPDE|nr:protein of unknown function [Taphrina deformans PYCC 5710]|eukprot:CCG83912.1 protein of unknown function [Taphrina deformans PYCC 5710]